VLGLPLSSGRRKCASSHLVVFVSIELVIVGQAAPHNFKYPLDVARAGAGADGVM
jgi:hypothetical protein